MNNLYAMYLRISREKNENEDTLQNHKERLERYCAEHNLVYDSYEEVVSGGSANLEDRPKMQELIDKIANYKAVICVDIDRLARNGLISQTLKQKLKEHKVKIITPAQTFDMNDYGDGFMYDLRTAFAEYEYNKAVERQKDNRKQRALRGEAIASAPYGYRRNPITRKLEIHEEEAKLIRYIFDMAYNGYGAFTIRERLQSEEVPTPKGGHWQSSTIKAVLRNESYKGTMIYRDKEKTIVNGKVKKITKDIIRVENAHEPIISSEVFDTVAKQRANRAEKTRIKKKNETFLLSDIIFCPICNHKMSIRRDLGTGKVMIKKCEYIIPNDGRRCFNSGITIDVINEAVINEIKLYRKNLLVELKNLKSNDTSVIIKKNQDKLESVNKQKKFLSKN